MDNVQDYKKVGILEDWMVDQRIEDIQNRNKEIDRLKEIAKKRIEEINNSLKEKVEKLENANHFDMETVKQAVLNHEDVVEGKTQYRVDFLSGRAIVKKGRKSIRAPKTKERRELAKKYPEFKKITEDIEWGKLTDRLVINGDKVIDKETGEQLNNLIDIVEHDEKLIIQ